MTMPSRPSGMVSSSKSAQTAAFTFFPPNSALSFSKNLRVDGNSHDQDVVQAAAELQKEAPVCYI
jgi:ethanolamine utilization microcompartment shell protein EutL